MGDAMVLCSGLSGNRTVREDLSRKRQRQEATANARGPDVDVRTESGLESGARPRVQEGAGSRGAGVRAAAARLTSATVKRHETRVRVRVTGV